jgi:hypothetical protein
MLESRRLTNLLLILAVGLLVADLAIPSRPAEPPAEPASVEPAPPEGGDVVIRIPGDLAREFGVSAEELERRWGADSLRTSRADANETAAIATLRNCMSAQAQFQAIGVADQDGDGVGEFGSFLELSGATEVGGRGPELNPPVLSGAFRRTSERGIVTRSGYCFVIYLPDVAGDGLTLDGEDAGKVDPDEAERIWCAYAWPLSDEKGSGRSWRTRPETSS